MAESLFERGRALGMSKETIACELHHAAKLNSKNRGYLAEMAFMRKASTMGFGVAKPWADNERYDFVLRAGNVFWRIQVKSVQRQSPRRPHYRIALLGSVGTFYRADEIDFVAAYIFAEDIWYLLPVSVVENRKVICVTPNSKRSRFEKYREAWSLMEPAVSETGTPPLASGPGTLRPNPRSADQELTSTDPA